MGSPLRHPPPPGANYRETSHGMKLLHIVDPIMVWFSAPSGNRISKYKRRSFSFFFLFFPGLAFFSRSFPTRQSKGLSR